MLYCKCGSLILLIPKSVLATVIVVLASVGTFATNKNMFDVYVMFVSGVIAYIMIRNDFPIAPIAHCTSSWNDHGKGNVPDPYHV